MNRRSLMLALLCGLTLALCLGRPTSSWAQASATTTQLDLPVTGTVTTCTGDTVALTGTAHTVFHVTVLPSGDLFVDLEANYQDVSGVGLTGITYRATSADHQTLTITAVTPAVFTAVSSAHLVAPGPNNNFVTFLLLHVTLNADGTVTANIDHARVECQ